MTHPSTGQHGWNKSLVPVAILAVAILVGLLAYSSLSGGLARGAAAPLSLEALEGQYGLRVNLIGVTAAGGMIDLRLKVLDAEKARALLEGQAQFPALAVAGSHKLLTAPEEAQEQGLTLEDNGMVYVLFPNGGNAVKPGDRVTVVFGEQRLEPIVVK